MEQTKVHYIKHGFSQQKEKGIIKSMLNQQTNIDTGATSSLIIDNTIILLAIKSEIRTKTWFSARTVSFGFVIGFYRINIMYIYIFHPD